MCYLSSRERSSFMSEEVACLFIVFRGQLKGHSANKLDISPAQLNGHSANKLDRSPATNIDPLS